MIKKRLHEKVHFNKEQLSVLGIESLLAYHKRTEYNPNNIKSIEELAAMSSIHFLRQRQIELTEICKSIKYNANIKGLNYQDNPEYIENSGRLNEVNLILDQLNIT